MSIAALDVLNLEVRYGDRVVVRDSSIHVAPGELVILSGPNGCGKTTLLDGLCGFLPHRADRLDIFGTSLLGVSALRRTRAGAGRLFQKAGIFQRLSIQEHMRLAMRAALSCVSPRPAVNNASGGGTKGVHDLLKSAGIDPGEMKMASDLSFGQQRILSLACLILRAPRLLVLDEPLVGLGERSRGIVIGHIVAHSTQGRATLVVEHHCEELREHAHRVVSMLNGRVNHGAAFE